MNKRRRIYNPITKRYYAIRTATTKEGKKGDILGLWASDNLESIKLNGITKKVLYNAHKYSLSSYFTETHIKDAIKIKLVPRKDIRIKAKHVVLQYLEENNFQAFKVLSLLDENEMEIDFNFKDHVFKF